MKDLEKSLDPQLWQACAGGMVNIPPVNSKVFYFPQGHAEHSQTHVDFSAVSIRIPPFVLCRVSALKFMADPESDEVFAKMRLVPLGINDFREEEDDEVVVVASGSDDNGSENHHEKPTSFAKTLTQSDANNGGGFSVPRYCAETIFPGLDYTADPPVQTVIAKDVHGEMWKFRHIFRGTPRRHLLTTGWSNFVNQKKLVAGDSIVFLRTKTGDICVGIRRAKRGIGGGNGSDTTSGWNNGSSYAGGFSVFMREDENKMGRNSGCGGNSGPTAGGNFRGTRRVRPEAVVEAAARAANGEPFEIIYYPRVSTPEFCVKASSVKAAMRIQWSSGMRFKMAFETEDSSRISWFMGTIASVKVADPIRWPNSPWRLLQVTWDEPDLLQNVKCVSPWLIESVANMPIIHMSSFSPPRKKLRFPTTQHPDFTFDGHFPVSSFLGNPLGPSSPMCFLPDNTPAGIQGARHALFGLSLSDLQLNSNNNKLQPHPGLLSSSFHQQLNQHSGISSAGLKRVRSDTTPTTNNNNNNNESLSCLLTMGNSSPNAEKSDSVKRHQFVLFGQRILTEQQISDDSHSDKAKFLSNSSSEKSSNNVGFSWHQGHQATEFGMDTGHCKVFMESEDVGRTLDLSALGSYEELYRKLANMFEIERSEMLTRVFYHDATGTLKQTGEEPFSDFMKTAKRLTIIAAEDSSNKNVGRTWITGMRNAENGLGSSNKTGPLSIFA
ncbi:hypothetical protein CsatA_008558 [Cannabis sativa]